MRVDVWSDVVCPWCLIGKRRLEAALALVAEERRGADEVELVFHSFELDPQQTPLPPGQDLADVLARKYGMPRARALAMMDHVTATAAEEGLAYDFGAMPRESGSFDAHRLLQLALSLDPALQVALKDRLMRAWFEEGRSIRDPDSLAALAAEAGLPPGPVAAVLADPAAFADAVRADETQARQLGITGVPFFVIDRRLGVSGAQPAAVLADALRQATPAPAGESCAADGSGC